MTEAQAGANDSLQWDSSVALQQEKGRHEERVTQCCEAC